MPPLNPEKILSTLREGGQVAEILPAYELRQAQLDLLDLVIRAFNEDSFLMAEAGTGVGKSFAYLLPAVHFALKTKEKVIISTATITLQQQLFEKDIPLVASAIGSPVKAVLMKGRGNYLCLRRLDEFIREPSLDYSGGDDVRLISEWARTTKTGAKNELAFLPSETVWGSVCSESDLCLASHCPWRELCFILALRKEANNASIIVVNHHLLFADLAARFGGAGYESAVILPPFSRLVIDEAHTIENAATSFFSSEFGRTGIFRQINRLFGRRRANRRGLLVKLCAMLPSGEDPLDDMADALDKIRSCAEELDDCALQLCGKEGIFRLSSSSDENFLNKALFPLFKNLRRRILAFNTITGEYLEDFPLKPRPDEKRGGDEKTVNPVVWEIKTIIKRLENAAEICGAFCDYKKNKNDVFWIEKQAFSKDPWAVFTRTPLDLAPKLRDSVFSPNKTVVCVSATLAINDDFSYWAGRCGIAGIENRRILSGCFPSPFPYSSAVLLAAPSDAPLPDEEGYQEFVNSAAGRLAAVAGGSALVLFTSYQSLTSAYNAAKDELAGLGIRALKQGDDDRSRLLQNFLSDTNSCLFATDSFWEGVDAPGDTLRLVILCRLPFRTPGDPVLEARREKIRDLGGNPFLELSLPQAVMKFKQGFGRLMRRSADHGVVVVLDGRLVKKNYGQLFLHSLPETRKNFNELNSILRDMESFLY